MNFSCVSYTNVVFNLSVPQVCIKVRLCVFSHLLKNEHVLKKSQKSATTAKRLRRTRSTRQSEELHQQLEVTPEHHSSRSLVIINPIPACQHETIYFHASSRRQKILIMKSQRDCALITSKALLPVTTANAQADLAIATPIAPACNFWA